MQITPTRNFNLLYIILDTLFIIILLCLLIYKKRNLTVLFALFGGILYTLVDFRGYYLLLHFSIIFINEVEHGELNSFLVLFWILMSYGSTNFIFRT